jgi:putative transposase
VSTLGSPIEARILGHTVARSTVANILREHGIEPAPERGERTPWRTFLTAHWESVAATDLFTVAVATYRRLVTYYVLVFVDQERVPGSDDLLR